MVTIRTDFSKPMGPIKPMHAVNNGPMIPRKTQLRSNFDEYKALGIPFARTHDASISYDYGAIHCVDVNGIFPDFTLDETDPANYDFAITDVYLKTIMDAGTEPYYRLGTRIEHWPKKYNTLPPADFAKWARICEHIIAHYTEGWANGFQWDIRYWEIWNEADLDPVDSTNKRCWGGTKTEFFEFFTISFKHLKQRFPHLLIGGPSLAHDCDWAREFLLHLKQNDVHLDFFSWHVYADTIEKIERKALEIRNVLDETGFSDVPTHLNEWNYIINWNTRYVESLLGLKSETGAAFIAAAMVHGQHLPIDMMMYYDARVCCEFNGIFDIITLQPSKPYYSILAFSKLARLGEEVYSHSDHDKIYSLCASNGSDKAGMIVYYDHEADAQDLEVEISLGEEAFRFYELSADKTLEEISAVTRETDTVKVKMKPNSFLYFCTQEGTV